MRVLRTLNLLLVAAGTAFILAAASFFALYYLDTWGGDDRSPGFSDAGTITGFDLRLERRPATATPEPELTAEATAEATPAATSTPTGELPRRLVIPTIGVDAPVVTIGVDGDGLMESPATPTDVGWYDFTAQPGSESNAVFSAHVDYHDYGPAVFWDLRELEGGDLIEVYGENGDVLRYAVVSSMSYPAAEAPVPEIVGPTERETVTLITCGGTFDSAIRQYSHRLVVQAERVEAEGASVSQ